MEAEDSRYYWRIKLLTAISNDLFSEDIIRKITHLVIEQNPDMKEVKAKAILEIINNLSSEEEVKNVLNL